MSVHTPSLVGAGRLGRTLSALWAREQVFQVQDLLTTRAESARAAGRSGLAHRKRSLHFELCQLSALAPRLAGHPPS